MIQTDVLKNGYKILQDTERFQFGIDAVLLADFAMKGCGTDLLKSGKTGGTDDGKSDGQTDRLAEKQPGRHPALFIDLGTGTGIIPLLMAGNHRWSDVCKNDNLQPPAIFTGLEVQKDSAEMAGRSVALNGLEGRIRIVHGDLRSLDGLFERHSFNVVTCNPPYMIDAHGKGNELDAKTIARHEVLCTLEDVVAAADYLLAPHGKFFMIHRPFRLPEIFESLAAHKLEPKRMRLIFPFANKEPNMVLIEARKNAKRRLTIEPPLIVRYDNGEYTAEVQKIYNSPVIE